MSPRHECDVLARDLVLDGLADDGGKRPAMEAPTIPVGPPRGAGVAGPTVSHPAAKKYERDVEEYNHCMKSSRFADAADGRAATRRLFGRTDR